MEGSIVTEGDVQAQDEARTAAEAAMARSEQPPAGLGGSEVEEEPKVLDGAVSEPAADREEPPEVPGRSAYATDLAARRHEGDDVSVENVEQIEIRDRVAQQRADDQDLEAFTEWLLSDEMEVNSRALKVRYAGSDDAPKHVKWIIRAIGTDTIRSAEREASGNRAQRRGGEGGYDDLKANLRIVVEGTAVPDLKALAQRSGISDATILVERKFRYRPGAIAQIAGEVMALSGFDAEDVRAAQG